MKRILSITSIFCFALLIYAFSGVFSVMPKQAPVSAEQSWTVTWYTWDGDEIYNVQVTEGNTVSFTGSTPTRPDDAIATNYVFAGCTTL